MQTVERAVAPNKIDIGAVAREHYDAVFRFCARRIGPDAAADAAQETFVTAQRAAGRFRGESSVTTWLFGIAHNECRRIARRVRQEAPAIEFMLDVPETGAEQRLVDRQALSVALAALSSEHREAVLLHEIEGLTYDEAAAVLGVPAGTVKSRLHHAFLQLRKTLLPDGGETK